MTKVGWHERLEASVERTLGTGDMRLLYGMGVPLLLMTALIIGAFLLESVWLAGVLMVFIAAFTVVILIGLNHMLDDEDDTRIPH